MQLAITVLGNRQTHFIEHILPAISRCHCNIVEISLTDLAESSAAYFLIEGNWNHIAKLENIFDSIAFVSRMLESAPNLAQFRLHLVCACSNLLFKHLVHLEHIFSV